jgi:serine/threonine protein phosphatase PrpC
MKRDNQIVVNVQNPQIIVSGISDVGIIREKNEDTIWIDESGLVMLLADGMGGHERGDEASKTAIEVFREHLRPDLIKKELGDITEAPGMPSEIASLYTLIYRVVGKAACHMFERNMELKLERYMGTTILGLILVSHEYVLWFHIGDSRLYRWRNKTLERLTTDHSAYAEWESAGRIGIEPNRNIITRVIGINPGVEADIKWEKREKDDTFILCSDGLTDMISDSHIEEILKTETGVGDIASCMTEAALIAGGIDNISVLVCKVL